MKTIHMGLNTEPSYLKADEVIERWKADGNQGMVYYWEREKNRTLELKERIIEAVEADGEVELSWSCDGETRHQMHSIQWAKALQEYKFEIGRYKCIVRKK